jgi:hypothetical protein
MMTPWRLLDYITESRINPIQDWYATQPDVVQVAFETTILTLKGTDDWLNPSRKAFKELFRDHAGLSEILLFPDGLWPLFKFRVAGLYRPQEREFIFLVGCKKRIRSYTPPGAFDIAMEYKKAFDAGKGTTREHV